MPLGPAAHTPGVGTQVVRRHRTSPVIRSPGDPTKAWVWTLVYLPTPVSHLRLGLPHVRSSLPSWVRFLRRVGRSLPRGRLCRWSPGLARTCGRYPSDLTLGVYCPSGTDTCPYRVPRWVRVLSGQSRSPWVRGPPVDPFDSERPTRGHRETTPVGGSLGRPQVPPCHRTPSWCEPASTHPVLRTSRGGWVQAPFLRLAPPPPRTPKRGEGPSRPRMASLTGPP